MKANARLLAAAAGLALVAASPAGAAPEKSDAAFATSVIFAAPDSGPWAAAAEEALVGVRAAFAARAVGDPAVDVVRVPLGTTKAFDAALAKAQKAGASFLFAFAPDGATAACEAAAEKAKLPLLVLSPEPTRPDLDRARAVFWAGGARAPDEALQAMDFLLQPLGVHRPAVLHDGSARGVDAAGRCAVLHHVSQQPRAPQHVGAAFSPDDARAAIADYADGIVYFGGPEAAERLLTAADAAGLTVPILLGQGLASRAVPTFASGRAAHAWALEAAWFEDHGGPAREDASYLADAAKAADMPLLAGTTRGWRAGRWVFAALRAAGAANAKKLVPELRALARNGARGRPVFDPWGHASLARLEPWRSPAVREDPACHRVRPTLMPLAGIPQIGTFRSDAFRWEPDTFYVHCTFTEGAKRTIEKDLAALGLHTGGYEAALEAQVLDDLLGRTMSRLNRLFLRNPDGSAIPGVSFRITFGAAEPPKGVKASHRWLMELAGDDPDAGGRASGSTAWVFTTFIQRTIYAKHAIAPSLSAKDRPYLAGTYKWGTSVEENLRGDTIRALLDGYTQGLALTGAHELGHLAGCGHDEKSPRSIMNVAEAVGLDFEWAEWIPDHLQILDGRIGR